MVQMEHWKEKELSTKVPKNVLHLLTLLTELIVKENSRKDGKQNKRKMSVWKQQLETYQKIIDGTSSDEERFGIDKNRLSS